jgi:serine/threonine protein kinase
MAYCAVCKRTYPDGTAHCPFDGTRLVVPRAVDALVGRTLDGRYEIRAPIGTGRTSAVYLGWQMSVDREVAIKVIDPALATRDASERLLEHVRRTSLLASASLVHVYDFGRTSDDIVYVVMELLRGRTLAAELAALRTLSSRRAVAIALFVCDALDAVHGAGLAHGELTPANLMLREDALGRDTVKVLDTGIARALAGGATGDRAADLVALGRILHDALAAGAPALPPHVPSPLREVIARLLAGQLASAGELRARLVPIRDAMTADGARPATLPSAAPALPGPPPASPAPRAGRSRILVIAIVALVLSAAGIAAILALG